MPDENLICLVDITPNYSDDGMTCSGLVLSIPLVSGEMARIVDQRTIHNCTLSTFAPALYDLVSSHRVGTVLFDAPHGMRDYMRLHLPPKTRCLRVVS